MMTELMEQIDSAATGGQSRTDCVYGATVWVHQIGQQKIIVTDQTVFIERKVNSSSARVI